MIGDIVSIASWVLMIGLLLVAVGYPLVLLGLGIHAGIEQRRVNRKSR